MVIVMKAGAEQRYIHAVIAQIKGLNYKASADSGHRARCHYGDWADVLTRL